MPNLPRVFLYEGNLYPWIPPNHQKFRSSMTLVSGMPLWLGVILHEGTTFLVARILRKFWWWQWLPCDIGEAIWSHRWCIFLYKWGAKEPQNPLCRRDRFKNPACTDKPINPPWTSPAYRFIGLSAQATPGPCLFIGLSARPPRQSDPMGFARLSVYRFIGAAHPWALPVYRFIGLSARPPRQPDPAPGRPDLPRGPTPYIGL